EPIEGDDVLSFREIADDLAGVAPPARDQDLRGETSIDEGAITVRARVEDLHRQRRTSETDRGAAAGPGEPGPLRRRLEATDEQGRRGTRPEWGRCGYDHGESRILLHPP